MIVSGIILVDLTRQRLEGADAARVAKSAVWAALADAPEGVTLRLVVPRWDWWSAMVADDLRDYGDTIGAVTVECDDAVTVRRWVITLRHGGHHLHPAAGWWSA